MYSCCRLFCAGYNLGAIVDVKEHAPAGRKIILISLFSSKQLRSIIICLDRSKLDLKMDNLENHFCSFFSDNCNGLPRI